MSTHHGKLGEHGGDTEGISRSVGKRMGLLRRDDHIVVGMVNSRDAACEPKTAIMANAPYGHMDTKAISEEPVGKRTVLTMLSEYL